jgi:hypothetical protein
MKIPINKHIVQVILENIMVNHDLYQGLPLSVKIKVYRDRFQGKP